MDVIQAMETRRSTRAYLDKEVARSDIELILNSASRAPSGVNSQPWQVCVVSGATKEAISKALLAERRAGNPPSPDYAYYPDSWKEPYRSRRIDCGKALYTALAIPKEDKTRQLQAWENNYRFFGAPVALLFFIDRDFNKGSWIDMGMYLENVMLAATGLGLATCPQASIAEFPQVVRQILGMEDQYLLVCGMALGYADTEHPVNQFRLSREPQEHYTTWFD